MTTDIIIEKIKLQKIRLDGGTQPRKEIEKMTVFGQDTIDSFTVFIRSMKK